MGEECENTEKGIERGEWRNKTEYILSCLGYAIGIGNVWRFPYLCYRSGGGAFLVPYLLMLFICGIPLFFLESSLGQFTSRGCISLFRMCPLFKGAGYAIVIVNLVVSTYFNTICSYPLLFLTYCFGKKLPWSDCSNSWNTEECTEVANMNLSASSFNLTKELSTKKLRTPADEFFHLEVLKISHGIDDLGTVVWPLFIVNFLSWTIIYLCIIKGVKSVGKVVYFTATFPFFVLFVLLIRGLTLPGAWEGVKYYILPEWEQLTNLKVWADAACQIFFSLGPGWGGVVNMASYNKFHNNNKLDSVLVPIANCGTSIFAGFVVFSVIGYMAHKTGQPIASVATGGPGLAFVTYPEAISMLPLANLWAILFFLMLFFLGVDSMFVTVESMVSGVIDEYPSLRKWQPYVSLAFVIIPALLSILYTTNGGMYWLQLFDWYSASISVVLICLLEVLMASWTYGVTNFVRDIEFMIKEKLSVIWIFSWKVVNPVILTFIFITVIVFNRKASYGGVEFPDWAISVGWCSCYVSIMCVPLYMGYRLLYLEEGDLIDRIKSGLLPRADWSPARNEDKKNWATLVLRDYIKDENGTPERDLYHEQFLKLTEINT